MFVEDLLKVSFPVDVYFELARVEARNGLYLSRDAHVVQLRPLSDVRSSGVTLFHSTIFPGDVSAHARVIYWHHL